MKREAIGNQHLRREDAAAAIEAFNYADPIPPCDAAVSSDGDMLGMEWTFPDGRQLIVDIFSNGVVHVDWSGDFQKTPAKR